MKPFTFKREFYVPMVGNEFLYFDMGFPVLDEVLPRRSSIYGSEDELLRDVIKKLDRKTKKIQDKSPSSMWQRHLDNIADVRANLRVAKVSINSV